jgi:hypothetical protein
MVIQGRFLGPGPQIRGPGQPARPAPPPGAAQAHPAIASRQPAQPAAGVKAHPVPHDLLPPAAGGRPLPDGVRAKMESVFGTDFSDVRVHVGPQATSIGAVAFTAGSRIVFAPGQYNPETPQGQALLGHELAHVVQQRTGRVRNPFGEGLAVVQDPRLEVEADRMSQRAASYRPPAAAPKPALQAKPGAPGSSHPSPVSTAIAARDAARASASAKPNAGGPRVPAGPAADHRRALQPAARLLKAMRPAPPRPAAGRPPGPGRPPRTIQRMENTRQPFPFRYDQQGTQSTMTMEETIGGFISRPVGASTDWQTEEMVTEVSAAVDIGHSDMPTGSKRAVTQGVIMGISPNVAANALGLSKPYYPNWEWLHLVAFSISPTHVGELSEDSSDLLERTNQPQQLRENLVLGTAASNTEMLSWETVIKKAAKHYGLLLQLIVYPTVMNYQVDGGTVPVCQRMKYHFIFLTPDRGKSTVPFIIEFDTLSHDKPTKVSFEAVVDQVTKACESLVSLPHGITGIRTESMHGF